MSLEIPHLVASREIPKADGLIVAGSDGGAVRFRKVERGDGCEVAGESLGASRGSARDTERAEAWPSP